jgi:S-adenosylmethionine decarboxylase
MHHPAPPPWPLTREVTGHHWLLDLSGCRAPLRLLTEAAHLQAACVGLAQAAGMEVVGQVFHQFQAPGQQPAQPAQLAGVTGVLLLAQSHLSVHTWPESKFVALDVYVCDHHQDNRARGQQLADAMIALFDPQQQARRTLTRGSQAPGTTFT